VVKTASRKPASGSLWRGLVLFLIISITVVAGIQWVLYSRTILRFTRGDEDHLLRRDRVGWRRVGGPVGIPYDMQTGSGGDVWVATYSPGGLSRWSDGRWTNYGSSHNPSGGFAVAGGHVWVANENGIDRFDGQGWHSLPAALRGPMSTAAEGDEVWVINDRGELAHCRGNVCDTHSVTNQIRDDAWRSHILGHRSRYEYNGGRKLGARTLVRSQGRLWFIRNAAWYSSDGREWAEWQGSGDDRVWALSYSGGRVWMKTQWSLIGIGEDLQATQFPLDESTGSSVYRVNAGDGRLVIATGGQGMFEHVDGGWRPVAIDGALHAEVIRNVVTSPEGASDGVMWITASRRPDFRRVFLFVVFIGMLVVIVSVKSKRRETPSEPISPEGNRTLIRFVHSVFGTIQHVRIDSPELDRRVRARYQAEINELNSLGFDYLCSDGETFSLFRLLLVLPAVVLIGMWSERMPVALRGASILVGYPVLVSKIRSTITNPDGRRMKFFTAFTDGTLLVSGTYADPTSRGPGIVRNFQPGTISEAWARHQARVEALVEEGKLVDRQGDHQAYVTMAERDTAAR
jgi:hypothetical protein